MKKTLSVLLILMLSVFIASSAGAADAPAVPSKAMAFLTGEVTEIHPGYDTENKIIDGKYFVTVEADGKPTVFVISTTTFVATGGAASEIKVGDTLTGYYDQSLPMIMIYPPQYPVIAVAVNADSAILVDVFDDTLTNTDASFQLVIGEETQVLKQDGSAYSGVPPAGSLLVVYQDAVAEPDVTVQTTPVRIVVWDVAIEDPAVETPEPQATEQPAPMYMVAGQAVEAPAYYENAAGVVMVPLRALAEALGHLVEWNGADQTVMLNGRISLTIGSDAYVIARMAPVALGTVPEIVNGNTFVPLSFFQDIVKLNNAYLLEGQIVLNNDAPVQ